MPPVAVAPAPGPFPGAGRWVRYARRCRAGAPAALLQPGAVSEKWLLKSKKAAPSWLTVRVRST